MPKRQQGPQQGGEQESGQIVRSEHGLEPVAGEFAARADLGGVEDQPVEAIGSFANLFGQRPHLRHFGEITGDDADLGVTDGGADPGRGGVTRFRRSSADQHACAGVGEVGGDGLTDAAGGPGHHEHRCRVGVHGGLAPPSGIHMNHV